MVSKKFTTINLRMISMMKMTVMNVTSTEDTIIGINLKARLKNLIMGRRSMNTMAKLLIEDVKDLILMMNLIE